MINIAPALYGQSDKYILVWIYIYAHMRDGMIYTNEDVCRQCNISRQGLSDILTRGVRVFNEKGIAISIYRQSPTSKFFTLEHDGVIVKERKAVSTPKKPKQEFGELQQKQEFLENIIVTYLNEQTGKAYRTDNKNTEYEKYLRPQTLFGNKFETYLNETINDQPTNTTSAQRIRNAEAIINQDWGVLPKSERE